MQPSKIGRAVVALLVGTMPISHALADIPMGNPFGDCRIVSNNQLAKMRGGFSINTETAQLDVAFAIERVTSINGQLQVLTQLNIPSVVAVAQAQAQAAVAASLSRLQISQNGSGATLTISGPSNTQRSSGTFNPVQVVQNGPGNSFSLPAGSNPSQFMTVIQNSLDNQTIRNATVINATVTNLGLLRALNATRLINQGIRNSLR